MVSESDRFFAGFLVQICIGEVRGGGSVLPKFGLCNLGEKLDTTGNVAPDLCCASSGGLDITPKDRGVVLGLPQGRHTSLPKDRSRRDLASLRRIRSRWEVIPRSEGFVAARSLTSPRTSKHCSAAVLQTVIGNTSVG